VKRVGLQDLSGKMKGRTHIGYSGVDERILLKWILKEPNVMLWTEFKIKCTGRP
jgi:hypothetical protein